MRFSTYCIALGLLIRDRRKNINRRPLYPLQRLHECLFVPVDRLRPTGDLVTSSGGRTSGPMSFGGIQPNELQDHQRQWLSLRRTWALPGKGSDVLDSFVFNIDNNGDQEHKPRH